MAGQSKVQNNENTENSQDILVKQKKKCVDFSADELAVLFDNIEEHYNDLFGRKQNSQYQAKGKEAWAKLV